MLPQIQSQLRRIKCMQPLELASHLLLWTAVIILSVFVLALARQIGLLHERFGLRGGARIMNVGPSIGQPVPTFETSDVQGRKVTLGVDREKRTLLLFISAACSTCAHLMPSLKVLAREEKDNLEIILVAFGITQEDGQKYAHEHHLDGIIPLVVSNKLALDNQISVVPYGLLVDRSGFLGSKGLVNHYRDIESLLNAEEMNVRSIQEYAVGKD